MTLTKKESKELACKWAESQTDLPKAHIVMGKNYKPNVGARVYEIQCQIPDRGWYTLVRLYVHDNGLVEVKSDRRKKIYEQCVERGVILDEIRHQCDITHGETIEKMMLALTAEGFSRPEWLLELERIQGAEPRSLHDATARIAVNKKGITQQVSIGIKVRSSKARLSAYYKKIAPQDHQRTVALIIRRDTADEEIRSGFCNQVIKRLGIKHT